jgi:hypothetical protein
VSAFCHSTLTHGHQDTVFISATKTALFLAHPAHLCGAFSFSPLYTVFNVRRMSLMQYQIKIRQTLDATWDEWFAPLEIQPQSDGTTLLRGDLPDQTALHSILNKIRNLNLELLSVTSTDSLKIHDETK